ncbi:MAG: hypothetical protein EOP56_15590 [Sphingobacteriales bacterium]|nr:MAG: hypothetical protein EOP56_15590 [Sphingobacteriales bacterium]
MWGEDKVWLHYRKDIMAADMSAASFLSGYLRNLTVTRLYTNNLEVIDLQKYKVIKQAPKVHTALRERTTVPFVFVVGKN